MIVEDLKKSILQLSIEGKLVSHNLNNDAKDELKKILTDTKDNKKYIYRKIDSNIFDIPSNWVWVRLEDICLKITDGTHSTPHYTENGVPFLSVKDVSSGYIDFNNSKFISKEEHNQLYQRCNPEYGDLIITKVGTTGVPAIVNVHDEFSLFVSVALLKINTEKIYNKFLYYFLKSPFVQKQVKDNTRGVGNKNWVLDAIKNTVIPLPPFEEQQRIVNKIEELFLKLDEVKPIEEELNKMKLSFTNNIKKAVLKELLYGKSTNKSNESAELNVESIICDKIPANWIRTKLKNISNITTGKKDANHGTENGQYLFYTCANVPIKSPTYSFDGKNLILPGNGANVGLTIYSEEKFEAYQRTYVVNSKFDENYIILKYIYYYFVGFWNDYNKNKMFGSAIPYIKLGNLENFEINIPPIEEQKRIIEKIEELLPLCDDIDNLVNS